MADVTDGVTLLFAQYLVAGLQKFITVNGTPIDPNAVFITGAEIDDFIGKFGHRPLITVIPGPTGLEDGMGNQGGGSLFRRQHYVIRVYQKFLEDRRGIDQQQILKATVGLLDFFEQIRKTLGLVQFGNADGTDTLLIEPMRYEGEGGNEKVNGDLGIVARNFNYSCLYGERLPTATTINLTDVT